MSAHTPEQSIEPLYTVEFSPWIRRLAALLLSLFVIAPLVALFVPWQQNVSGAGRVAAFTPLDRTQAVQAPVSGRVVEVMVTEAQQVKKGDPLVKIVDIDPQKISRLEAKLEASSTDLDFRSLGVTTLEAQITILEQARDLAVDAFRAKVEVAEQTIQAAEQRLLAAEAERSFALEQEQRIARLSPEFVEEIRLLEATAARKKADAGVATARAELESASASLRRANAELGEERQVANAKVEEARSKMQEQAARAAQMRSRIVDLEGEIRAQNSQLVTAPRDGRVFRLRVNTDASIVRAGAELLQIVPLTSEPAVELWVRGVDAPLIEPGRKVRLQFEGWPAVQFVGWPSVAVGTFGGLVSLVDPTDSGNGRFRLMVVPDPDDEPWPDGRWLRQGVRTKAWVLLNEVPVWFELWRQLNGFPPAVALSEPETTGDGKEGQR